MICFTAYPSWPSPSEIDIHRFEADAVPRVGEELCLMYTKPRRSLYLRVLRVRWGVAMHNDIGPQFASMSTAELWCEEIMPEG